MHEVLPAPDSELVRSYARDGSESAFRALVERHVHLVFATARRQVGDPGLAEEISQNVFVALARKAPRLAGHQTLAGWLHRTALLEAKARIRAELRRRRREQTAASLAAIESSGAEPALDLSPLLDEALLDLRESDRLALVLRFLEERSLREVGSLLGIDEDAARKRVSRALGRVTEFFRARGFLLPASGGAAVLGQAAQAAALGLAASAVTAGLAAGGPATGLSLASLYFMTLHKSQLAVVCALCCAAPLAWLSHVRAGARESREGLARQLDGLLSRSAASGSELARLREDQRRVEAENSSALARLRDLQTRRATAAAPATKRYQWDDLSPVARIPKALLEHVSIPGVANRRGLLSPQITAALQLSDSESHAIQSALDRFVANYEGILATAARPVDAEPHELQALAPEEMKVFEVRGIAERVQELTAHLFADLSAVLDQDRLPLFKKSLDGWMRVNDQPAGFSTELAIYDEDHRFGFFNPRDPRLADPDPTVGFTYSVPSKGFLRSSIPLSQIPDFLRPSILPWIEDLRRLPVPSEPPPGSVPRNSP